jgi:hypothetical protein
MVTVSRSVRRNWTRMRLLAKIVWEVGYSQSKVSFGNVSPLIAHVYIVTPDDWESRNEAGLKASGADNAGNVVKL